MKSHAHNVELLSSISDAMHMAAVDTASCQDADSAASAGLPVPLPTINEFFENTAPHPKEGSVPSGSGAIDAQAALEGMPHLLGKIQNMWKSRDLNTFIAQLFLDSRDGNRAGFPFAVARELIFLAKINLLLRAEEAAPLLGLKLAEAVDLIAQGDQLALGHSKSADDIWVLNVTDSKKHTGRRPDQGSLGSTLTQIITSSGQAASRQRLSARLSAFLNDTPPLPPAVRLDLTTPKVLRSARGSFDEGGSMDNGFFRCMAKELSGLQIERLVLSSLGDSTQCDWLASAIRFTGSHCRFKTVVLHVDLLSTPENQLQHCIKEGLDHLVIYLNQASGKWRARAQEMAAADPDYFRREVQRLISFRDEHKAKTGHFCRLSVTTNTHRATHALGELLTHLNDQPGLEPYVEILLPAGVNNQDAKARGPCHCLAPFIEAHIRTNGHLVACAQDHSGYSFTADLKQANFTDAWLSQAFRKTRQRVAQGEKAGRLCEICPHRSPEFSH